MRTGIILHGVGGIYEVQTEQGPVSCTLRGRLRLEERGVLVGDRVEISLSDTGGVVETILPRQSELQRPPIANVQQVLVVFAAERPQPDLLLLDRILVQAYLAEIQAVLIFNKKDLAPEKSEELKGIYEGISYSVLVTSAKTKDGVEKLKDVFQGKITTLAGPSGVGKSSLLNAFRPQLELEVRQLSKIGRGRHTTKTVSLLPVAGGYVADTPGFSQLATAPIPQEELQHAFPEISALLEQCRFRSCLHHREPGCAVIEAVQEGLIPAHRYKHYILFLEEIQARRPY